MFSAFLKRIRKDVAFRIKSFLCASFIYNIIYSLFLLVIGLLYVSKWFFVASAYYALLSVVRVFIFMQIDTRKKLLSKIKAVRLCGYFLLIINVAVSSISFLLLQEAQGVEHHEITVISMATYTFSALTVAIVNSVRYIKKKDYLHSCIKIVSLVSASVSLLTLTDTMLSTFGEDNGLLKSIILPILSIFVAFFIILCALVMIRKTNLYLGKLINETERK